MGQRVLVVDDDPMIQRASRRLLERACFDVAVAGSVWAAQLAIASHHFDVALLDYYLEDDCGCALIKPLRLRNQSIRIVVVSGLAVLGELASHALGSGADVVASKVDADWVALARAEFAPPDVRPEVDLWALRQQLIRGALLVHRRNVSETARALGINRASLHRALRKMPLPDLDDE